MADKRSRAIGLAGALAANALIVAVLLTLNGGAGGSEAKDPDLVAIVPAQPAPSPTPDAIEEGASGETSRGAAEEPSQAAPELPLPMPRTVEAAPDPGSGASAGAGQQAGSSAGTGGEGTGRGAGTGGAGSGSGAMTPPVRIAGALTDRDYRRANPPRGAGGTVVIGFRVRPDGRVDQCRVERSSGYAVLDEATCRLVTQRFRFRPARNAAGEAIAWSLRTDFTWVPR